MTTARHFKITPAAVRRHLKFWWPGKRYLEEFGEKKSRRPKWDRTTGELLKALNEHGSVGKAAKALGTTPVTLAKALERHRIVQRWMVEASQEDNGRSPRPLRTRRRRPEARYVWSK